MTRSWSAGGSLVRLASCALPVAVLAAVAVQDHSGALPLGLFNEGRRIYAVLSWACAGAASVILAVFLAELGAGRPLRGAGTLRGLLVALVLVEVLLALVDVTLLSRGEARLGGPYRELRGPDGSWVTLKKVHAGSPLGFRSAEPPPLRSERPRVLFLGDSYTEGSGRAPACNYPEVAAATLGQVLGREVEALNAGVAGSGAVGAARVFDLLVSRGYRFDAVVFGLFLENDFSDDLPGTERRVVAGMNFRFPRSRFLRLFHPLNTRMFRFGLFVQRTSRFVRGGPAAVHREDGVCDLEPRPLEALAPGLRALVTRRLAANYGPDARVAADEVARGIEAMRDIARRLGVPFVVVVFPDRILVDGTLRALLERDPVAEGYALDRLRRFLPERFPDLAVIDATPALRDGSANYRPEDTHLSDLGNLRAGRFVGRALAPHLRTALASPAAGSERGASGLGSGPRKPTPRESR